LESTRSTFPRISDYGFLSDCHTGALVAPDGSVEWLCLPRFDSPSVFGAILDRSAGSFRLGPPDERVPVSRRYEPGTNVLETTWMTPSGWLLVRDTLAVRTRSEDSSSDAGRESPLDHEAGHLLVRTAECLQGEVQVALACEPAFDYATRQARWERLGKDQLQAATADVSVRLVADFPLKTQGGTAHGDHVLSANESCFCTLSWGPEDEEPGSVEDARNLLVVTRDFWRAWLATGRFPDHQWRDHLQRSALALKGLTYAPTGAMLAAPTTSLPETPGGERNWDYRYTWIRDSTFTLWALHVLGIDPEASSFMKFMTRVRRDHGPQLQIMYGIGGEKELPERTFDHLSGYEQSRPVRVGNAAHAQRQNDVYGALVDSIYVHRKVLPHLPDEMWSVATEEVEAAAHAWGEPDRGIWEARGEPKHYVSSKVMCWVALDRGARLAQQRGELELARQWEAVASDIRSDVLERGVSARGVFRQHYETDALDASSLLVPLVRFLPPDDDRVRSTVLAVADELTDHGLVLRYRVHETDDGFRSAEGTFTLASFWLVSALSEIGERERAKALCERLLALASPLLLFAEELDPSTGRHLGNFPQAFTHLGLINAVSHVIDDELAPPVRPGPTAVFRDMRARHGLRRRRR
jgi:alpha,alpha-trehalase